MINRKKQNMLLVAISLLFTSIYGSAQSSISQNGHILKKGAPYFPFGCYGLFYTSPQEDIVKSILEMSRAGMNVVFMTNADNNPGLTNFLNLLDTCSKYKMDVVMGASNNSFLKYRISQCKNKPALLGYTLADDADDGVKATLEECKLFQQEARTADPTRVTHLTLTGWNAERRSKAAEFIAISDFCSYQIYPICQHRFADFTLANSLTETYKRTLAYVLEAEKVNKPFIMLPQTFSWGSQSNAPCYPTTTELRNMVYSGLASGVKGVVSYDFSFDLINNQKPLWQEYSDLGQDVRVIQSYLLNKKITRHTTGDSELVISSWVDSDTTLILAINTSYSADKNINFTLDRIYRKAGISPVAKRNTKVPQILGNKMIANLKATEVMLFKIFEENITDLTQHKNAAEFSASLNQNNKELHVYNASIGSELLITDITGRVLIKDKVNAESQKLDLSSLRTGIYLVKTETNIMKIQLN